MATWLYNKEFPTGKLFDDAANLEELAADGWVDTPTKIVEETEPKDEPKDKEVLDRAELFAKATELGLEFPKTIKTIKLKELIDEASKEEDKSNEEEDKEEE